MHFLCASTLLRVDPATSGSFSVVLTHIAQGDRKFVAKDYPNQFPPPQSLGTHASAPYTRIWAPGGRYWAHRSAPRRAIGALCSHDGRKDATMIFRSNLHIPRITMAIEPIPRLCGANRRSPRLGDVLVPHILEYGCPRAHIGRARRGARAPWEAMMRRMVADGAIQAWCTGFA